MIAAAPVAFATVGEDTVVVTGKGYLDVATRIVLASLNDIMKPVFALVDLDHYGVRVVAAVWFGSKAMTPGRPMLRVEGLTWRG